MNKTFAFIKGIWGIYSNKNHFYTRKTKVDKDVQLSLLNPYAPVYRVYVFGEDNFKAMIDLGFDCLMVDKKPFVWDMETTQYRHKLEVFKCGLSEFDEVVFTDWDCIPLQPIPKDFWRVLGAGEKIQASNFQYKKSRCSFRPGDTRKVSAATFVYMREKEIGDGIIKTWEDMGMPLKEELALSKYIDDLGGGWKGIENYKKYEPRYHNTFWYYDKDFYVNHKDPIFCHFNTHRITFFIGDKNKDHVKSRLDNEYLSEAERQRKCYKN
jgi:hypothetical protein